MRLRRLSPHHAPPQTPGGADLKVKSMRIRWAVGIALFLVTAAVSLSSLKRLRNDHTVVANVGDSLRTAPEAERIGNDFKHFFETEIRKYDASSDEDFKEKSTVALWHKAISRLDIPQQEEDDGESNLTRMKRFLSSVMTEISGAAYPDPNHPEDPNHDWIGRAGGGRHWSRKKNRANHDSLNHMRSAAISLHFVHLVQEHRPDLWDRILSAHGIQPGSDDERLYLLNLFVASYLNNIFRFHEAEGSRIRYSMSEDAKDALLMEQFSLSSKENPELGCGDGLGMITTAWFLRRIGQTEYYRPLLGKYLNQMVKALISVNIVEGTFTDPRAQKSQKYCTARAFLHDEQGVEYDLEAVSDDKLAAHFDMGLVYVGHFIDHIRINYSHFTKPVGCASVCTLLMYEIFFGMDQMQRIRETYSFWTYLTHQAGIVSSETGYESVFNRMKSPDEIRFEMGKAFFTSNPWAGRNRMAIGGIWDHLTEYPPEDEAQNKFQALCKDFNLFFDSFFAEQHLRRYLGERTSDFFLGLFR